MCFPAEEGVNHSKDVIQEMVPSGSWGLEVAASRWKWSGTESLVFFFLCSWFVIYTSAFMNLNSSVEPYLLHPDAAIQPWLWSNKCYLCPLCLLYWLHKKPDCENTAPSKLDTAGYSAVNRIINSSVSQCLLALHLVEVCFSVERWLCIMLKTSLLHQYTWATRTELEFELTRSSLFYHSFVVLKFNFLKMDCYHPFRKDSVRTGGKVVFENG